MMEPDPEIQVEITAAVNGSSTPNDTASEKKNDEKNLSGEAKFIQETGSAEETKDEKKKGVDIDRANDETNIAEEKNGENNAKPEVKAEVEVKVNDKGNNAEVGNNVKEKKDENKLKVNEEITKTEEKKDGNEKSSGEKETHGESNSKGDIMETYENNDVKGICVVENMKKTEEKDDDNRVVKEIKEVENKNTREIEDKNSFKDEHDANKVDEGSSKGELKNEIDTKSAKKVGERTETEIKAKDDLEITDVEDNRNEIQHVEVREGSSEIKKVEVGEGSSEITKVEVREGGSEIKKDEEREDSSDMKKDEEREDKSVIKKDEGEVNCEDKNSFKDEYNASKADEEINNEELKNESDTKNTDKVDKKLTEAEVDVRDDVEMMVVEENDLEIKNDEEREDNSSDIKKDVEREENISEIRKAEEREGGGDNGNEDVEMAEADSAEAADDSTEKEDGESTEKVNNYNGGLKKKRSRSGWKISEKVSKETKNEPKEMEKKESVKEPKELKLNSPMPSSIDRPDRPVRERKTVERLVEVIEKEPNKSIVIEKGQGTSLKDIPKVAYRLARKKPGDLKLLHQTLFGRKGKAVEFKNHLLKFSGFVRHESDEKQRAKVKDRLDKCVNKNLIEFCELLNISPSKTNAKKEDLITKLLDFLAAPYIASSTLLSEDDQETPKSQKHKRDAKGSASKSSDDTVVKSSNKKGKKSVGTQNYKDGKGSEEDEDELNENKDSENENEFEDNEIKQSESENGNESEREEVKDEHRDEDMDSEKGKQIIDRTSAKMKAPKKVKMKTENNSKKVTIINNPIKETKVDENTSNSEKVFARKKKNDDLTIKNSTSKLNIKEKSSSKLEPKAIKSERKAKSAPKSKSEGSTTPKVESKVVVNDDGEKVFVRKRRNVDLSKSTKPKEKSASKLKPKEKSTSKSESKAKSASKAKPKGVSTSKLESNDESISKSESEEKISNKKSMNTGGKAKLEKSGKSNPNKEELRMTICDILKQVDFSTATFTDILNRLCKHYKADLTPRKISIKTIIQEELTKLADEIEDEEESSEEEKDHRPKIKKAKV